MKSQLSIPFYELKALAEELGLTIMGASLASAKPIEASRLRLWQEKGYAAEMKYMLRDPDLQSDPNRLLPGARSVISISIAYDTSQAPKRPHGFGKVARYAWGKDYHLVLPELLKKFVLRLQQKFGDFQYRYFSDAVPLLERSFAASAGLGFVGKNTLIIRPKIGSFTLLSEIVSDLEITGIDQIAPLANSCGSCNNCLDSCPTKAFESEFVLDAGKCISYLSIEKKGNLSYAERRMLGEWIFGCDVCQEVCPFNHGSLKQERPASVLEFTSKFGAGPLLNLAEVLELRDSKEFKKKFQDSPILRAKREGLIRNAICVAVNTNVFELIPTLKDLARNDGNALVRQFSLWGVTELVVKSEGKLGSSEKDLLNLATKDPDPNVQAEASDLIQYVPC